MAGEAHVVGVHCRELFVDDFQPAAELERYEERDDCSHDHQDALNEVGKHDRADAARHAVEHNGDAHHDDADPFGRARIGREDHAAADRLRAHHRDEEDEHEDGKQTANARGLITVGQVVGHREHVVAVTERDESTADEKRRNEHRKRDARHRDGHPGVADVVNRPGHAHKGRHGVLRGEVGDARENGARLARHREVVGEALVFLGAVPAEAGENETVEDDDAKERYRHRRGINDVIHLLLPSVDSGSSSSNSWYSGRFKQLAAQTPIMMIVKSP